MKILFVDLEYDYGDKKRGINTIGQLGFKKSFEKLNNNVVSFYYDNYLPTQIEQLQIDLKNKADEEKPDLIFFILFKDQFKYETLDYLKSKYHTMNWFGDDTWRFESFSKHYAPHFSSIITTDKFSVAKYRQTGVKRIILSQWAAIDDDGKIEPQPYKHTVSFVGGFNRYRAFFIKQLEKKGIKVECFGHGWANGPLSNEDMIKVFASSKINLNLSNSNSFDLRYLLSHPKNLALSLYSKKHASQIKARNFEINFFSGFQLTDYVPTLEDYYDIGKELACYSNVEEAALLIDYYLVNEKEREEIRDRGTTKARLSYTYTGQLKKVLQEMGE